MGTHPQPAKNGSAKSRIVDSLRASIYRGERRPGDALLELQLAREFQVSQTPVREALLQLEQLGLVRRIANRGTFVTKLLPEEVRERVDLRMHLEELAAAQALARLTPAHVATLQQRVADISAAIARNDYHATARADLEFHRALWSVSGNQTLYGVLDQLSAPLFAFISIVRSEHLDDLRRVVHSHQEIVAALTGGDPEAVRRTLRAHFADSYERFVHANHTH